MRAAIYSPYLDTLGGGERYVLSVARVLLETGWAVDIQTSQSDIVTKVKRRFGFDLTGAKCVDNIKRGDGYDLCFWLSDGSVPTLFARKNIVHFQRPFSDVDGSSLINKIKFFRINAVVVNSGFTKKWIDREYPKESVVVYPPVDVTRLAPGRKENMILYVGRFSQLEQSKRQDILVGAFSKLVDKGLANWQLVLAGGSEVGRTDFVENLRKRSTNYPIQIVENPDFKKIVSLYSKARIFWSASGFGVDELKLPQKLEHFGISVVEAMASGAVPVVFDAGGHKEIVSNSESGYLWKTESELLAKTLELVSTKKRIKEMALRAQRESHKYSYARFKKEILELLN